MKTDLTVDIECALIHRFYCDKNGKGLRHRYALECQMLRKPNKTRSSFGRVDFVSKDNVGTVTCVEIKISKSDFKSKSGHNLGGNKNYYAIPAELLEYVKLSCPNHVGILVYENGVVSVAKNAKSVKDPYLKKYLGEHLDKSMMTANNSTIRRLYDKKDDK